MNCDAGRGHVNAEGEVFDRAWELAATFDASDQIVDVYALQGGVWKALTAQEQR